MTLTIVQGTTCAIVARDIRIDGVATDITGWPPRAGSITVTGVATATVVVT